MGQSRSLSQPAGEGRFRGLACEGILKAENIELRFIPLHDIRRGIVSTFFCVPAFMAGESELVRGYGAFRILDPSDLPGLDCAMLEHALAFARRLDVGGVVAGVGTPVNFETLASRSGRLRYFEALNRLEAVHDQLLVVKIEAVPVGTPDGRLHDIMFALRTYARRVFVHLSECDSRLAGYGHVNAAGIVTSLPPRATRPVVMAVAKSLQRACEAQSAVACIDGVENRVALDLISAIGIRFAAGDVFGEESIRADASIESIRRLIGGRVALPTIESESSARLPARTQPMTPG